MWRTMSRSKCWEYMGRFYDDVIKWKHFPHYWPFVRGIHRPPVNSPHRGQWCEALMFSLICAWINAWVNNREAGYLRRYRAQYYVNVMSRFDYPLRGPIPIGRLHFIFSANRNRDNMTCHAPFHGRTAKRTKITKVVKVLVEPFHGYVPI